MCAGPRRAILRWRVAWSNCSTMQVRASIPLAAWTRCLGRAAADVSRRDVPVVQLGIDSRRPGAWHLALARRLAPLRDEGIMVVASGDIVHNLRLFDWRNPVPLPWALRFRDRVNALVRDGDLDALADWPALGEDARLSIPTPEHYLPLLYALALARDGDAIEFFNDDVIGSLSMTSLLIGHA